MLCCRALAIAIAAALLLAANAPGRSDSLDVRLEFVPALPDLPRLADGQSRARRITRSLEIPGFSASVSSGDPALPCRLIYVALPPDADPATVEVAPGSYATTTLRGVYDIAPVPPAAAASQDEREWGENKQIEAGRNLLVYGKDEFYPPEHVRVAFAGRLRSWKIAAVEFWPYCYNPVSGKLRVVDSCTASISWSNGPWEAPAVDPAAVRMSGFVVNRGEASQWYPGSPRAVPVANYVVITTDSIASASRNLPHFVEFQAARGYSVKIATEADWGGGAGNAAADNIRNWLAANYLSLGIEYVLLIGNPNPVTGDVPMKMLWPRRNEPTFKEAPSDYYYADLTGNWDRDQDGYAGESPDDFGSGGIDRIPEVYVGRIPFYGSIGELDSVLRKTADYESAALGDWSRRVLLPMKPLDIMTPCYQLGEQIAGGFIHPLGLSPVRIYDDTYGLDPVPERVPCDYETVRQEWQRGAGFVLWMTHGSDTTASSVFASSECANLDDAKPAIVYAGSCHNGRPENSSNLATSLLSHGAAATVSASRVSWYYIGETNFRSTDSIGGIGYGLAQQLIKYKETAGRAIANARLAVPLGIWPNHLVFNLYGDPSLAFDQPMTGAVTGTVLTVDGYPIPNALIQSPDGPAALSKPDGSYFLGGFRSDSADIVVHAYGYYSQRFRGLPTARGTVTRLDFRLVDAIPGAISGRVLDVYGAPVYDASVVLLETGDSTGSLYDGSFSFGGLSPGTYTLAAYRPAHGQGSAHDCIVSAGKTAAADVVLVPKTGSLIANGSFEAGFVDSVAVGWTAYAGPDYKPTLIPGTDRVKQGAKSQKLQLRQPDSEAHAGIYQTVNVVPGRTYTLVAWQRNALEAGETDPKQHVVGRMGWDATGGTDYAAPTVVWRDFDWRHGFWHSLFQGVYAYTDRLTVFLDVCRKPGGGDECYAWFDAVSLVGPIDLPRAPRVLVTEAYQSDPTNLRASWSSLDADIASYECAVSRSPSERDIVPGGGWSAVGSVTSTTRTGLTLVNGQTYRMLVRATDSDGLKSPTGCSAPVRIVKDLPSVGLANREADGTWVRIREVVLSRMGEGPGCFVQDQNRIAGARVVGEWSGIPYVAPGTVAAVIGRLATDGGMRVLAEAELMPGLAGLPPRPLGLANRSTVTRLANYGVLVTVWGRVTGSLVGGFIVSDGSASGGLPILCRNGVSPPASGSFVVITGIWTPDGIAVYNADDIVRSE